jgi:hypothetical protein
MEELQLEQQISRWEDQRTIKNLMGKYALTMLLEERDQAFDRFWSSKEDVCLGVNEGWYVGAEEIRSLYQAQAQRTAAESQLMTRLFPDKLAKLSEKEQYGVGHLDNRPVSTPVIAVAEDGQTAKGMWTSMGCYVAFDPEKGPQSHWNWSVYAVDFVKEGESWRIWHMQQLTEIDTLCGSDWTKGEKPSQPRPEFAELKAAAVPGPSHPAALHTAWSVTRCKNSLPPLPQSYGRFEDTFSYGM